MSTEATLWTNKYRSTDATKIKKVLKGKYEQLDVNKYENFDEIKEFWENIVHQNWLKRNKKNLSNLIAIKSNWNTTLKSHHRENTSVRQFAHKLYKTIKEFQSFRSTSSR